MAATMTGSRTIATIAAAIIAAAIMIAEVDEMDPLSPGVPPQPDKRPASPELRAAVLDAFVARGYDRDEVERTIRAESGWLPHVVGRGDDGRPIAAGLIQLTDGSLKTNGWTRGVEAFAAASETAQLPIYQRFLSRMPRANRPGDSRLVLFWPVAVRDDWPDERVIASVVSIGFPAKVWEQNPTLREGYPAVPMGPITAGSVRATVRAPGPVSP